MLGLNIFNYNGRANGENFHIAYKGVTSKKRSRMTEIFSRTQNIIYLLALTLLSAASPQSQAQTPTNALMSILNILLEDDDGDDEPGTDGGSVTPGGGTGSGATGPGSESSAMAGTLPGALAVARDGAATYAIPLAVPPGTAGLQPQLSLSYASSGPNGALGLGWTLAGISSIQRCAPTIAQDEATDRIGFTTSDRLCLDGQRLVLVNLPLNDDNYWSENAEFRTEQESFSRILVKRVNGQRVFSVESKDGLISTFGSGSAEMAPVLGTPQSGRLGIPPETRAEARGWALAETKDRSGNFIRYTYAQDNTTGEHLIATIHYGASGRAAHAGVSFAYESRNDAWTRYLDDVRVDVRSRLANIVTYVGENLDPQLSNATWVRKYALNYEYSPTSGRSLLASINACARHPETGLSNCYPATLFDWGKPDPAKAPGFTSVGFWNGPLLTTFNSYPGWASANHPDYFVFADFENHGLTDVLEKRVASPLASHPESPDRFVLDMHNPLARGTMRKQYRYFHNTGSNFTQYFYQISVNGTSPEFAVLEVGDFDGDGSPDLLVATKNYGAKICMSPLGTPTGLPEMGKVITFNCTNRPAVGSNDENEWPTILDIHGNGRVIHYGRYMLGKATKCTEQICVVDNDPPIDLLSPGIQSQQEIKYPMRDYLAFSQWIDFGGTGRAYNVRWNQPYIYMNIDSDGTPSNVYQWLNAQAIVGIYSFGGKKGFGSYFYPEGPEPCTDSLACTPFMFDYPGSGGGSSGDFNGSGYSGVLFGYMGLRSTGYGFNPPEFTVCLSTGRQLDCRVRKKYSGSSYLSPLSVGDFVGDGAPAILSSSVTIRKDNTPWRTDSLQMCRLTGDDTSAGASTDDANMNCTPWSGRYSDTSAQTGAAHDEMFFMDLLGTGRSQIMYYHAGKLVNGAWQEDGRWELFVPVDVAREHEALDRITKVTNGIGAVSRVEYQDSIPSKLVTLTADSRPAYPVRVGLAPGKLVSRLLLDNGVAGMRTTRYAYSNPALDLSGRGALGFATVSIEDEQTGVVTKTDYAQSWPYTGMMTAQTVKKDGVLLQNIQHQLAEQRLAQKNGTSTSFPYSSSVIVERADPAGADLGTVTTENKYGDNWGNLTERTVSTSARSDSAAKYVTRHYTDYRNDDTSWLLGLPVAFTEERRHPVSGSLSRTIIKDYDKTTGLLVSEEVEAGNKVLSRKVTYQRDPDAYGQVTRREESWTNPHDQSLQSRTSIFAYDVAGRYLETIVNPAGHAQTFAYSPGTGAKIAATDANGNKTVMNVDGFGVPQKQRWADGTETRRSLTGCQRDCPSGAVLVQTRQQFHGTSPVTVPEVNYIDSNGHLLQTRTWGYDGRAIVADHTYDRLGRSDITYWPRYESESQQLQRRVYYDVLSRPTLVETADETGARRTSSTNYFGTTTVSINERQQKRTEIRSVIGTLDSVIDNLGGKTSFEYDAFGNLTLSVDPMGNRTSVAYDSLGRRTDLRDPDLGWLHYEVDPLGRIWKTISPKQRAAGTATRMVFDQLDRMVDRLETDLESHWIYDTAAHGIGHLAEAYTGDAKRKDYRRVQSYDRLGRPLQTHQTINGDAFVSGIEFDNWGRLGKQTYRRNAEEEKVYDYRYNHNGYLARVERSGLALWSVSSKDASGRLLSATLGNGLTQKRTFYPYTGMPATVRLESVGGKALLEESYGFDALGNVTQRDQYWDEQSKGFSETFRYDGLNRIEASTVTGQVEQRYTYDAIGNIQTKSNVSNQSYEYPQAGSPQPHAVSRIGGYGAFSYDANGNQETAPGRTTKWTSFDMPLEMTKGSVAQSYVYGPEHQRLRMNRKDEGSSIIYAGAQEVESKGGVVQSVKTYWPNGIGVEIDKPGAVTEMVWTHADRLGSIIALTDAQGAIKERLAYDAWGKRRTQDGSSTPDTLDGQVDRRGYTGHEMLDALDLVHMNGRVYDPLVGRFLSGDPLIQDPTNGQSYNRYTYVMNNPTNMTDPTGFQSDPAKDPTTRMVGSYCGSSIMLLTCRSSLTAAIQKFLSDNPGAAVVDEAGRAIAVGAKFSRNPDAAAGGKDGEAVGASKPITEVDRLKAMSTPELMLDGLKRDPSIQSITQVIITGKKLISNGIDIASDDAQASATAWKDFRANWVSYANSLMVIGSLRRGGNPLNKAGSRPPNMSPPGAGRGGAFNEAKRQSGIPTSQQPSRVLPNEDLRGNPQPGTIYEFEVPASGGGVRTIRIRDDAGGHEFGPGNSQNRGPHFNDEAGNHYDYKK